MYAIGPGFTVALLDTILFYPGVTWLSRYPQIDPHTEHHADVEEPELDNPA